MKSQFILSLTIAAGLILQAGLANAAITQSVQVPNQKSMAMAGQPNVGKMTDNDCSAYTTCANGAQISCWSTGTASCRWTYNAGDYVLCEGWGTDGSYSWYRNSCN